MVAGLVIVAVAPLCGAATTVVEWDFNSIYQDQDSELWYTSDSSGNGFDGVWKRADGNSTQTVLVEDSPSGNSGDYSAQIEDLSWHELKLDDTTGVGNLDLNQGYNIFRIELDIKPSAEPDGDELLVGFGGSGGSLELKYGDTGNSEKDITFYMNNFNDPYGGNKDASVNVNVGEWNHIEMEFNGTDPDNGTVTIRVNDSEYVREDYMTGYESPALGEIDDLKVTFEGGGLIDNFRLSVVPEPGSIALLGLGGLAMLRRRRKA
jgi:hypothetical protein